MVVHATRRTGGRASGGSLLGTLVPAAMRHPGRIGLATRSAAGAIKTLIRRRLQRSAWPWPAGLEIGLDAALHIREERLSARHDGCLLLYVSDIHLRSSRSKGLCRHVLEAAVRSNPDAVLLGGDLVDRPSELGSLSRLVRTLTGVAPVLAIGGNHDRRVGLTRVGDAVVNGGGQWIHDRVAYLTHASRVIAVSGPESAPPVAGDVRVLCAHDPRIWRTARHDGYDLVLAGHLHGCQLVAWEYRDRLFPGALFYPYCFSSHRAGSTRLVVSRGVSDLVPLRWKCPREVVLCHV